LKIILLLSLVFNLAFCEIVVIVSTKNKLIKVTKKELTDIYLKKKSKIRGISLVPINNRQSYAEFCKKVMNKTPRQMRAYWAKELYKGTKTPPKVKNNAQIKSAIKKNKRVVSYASNKLTGKIILSISK
jgi:hypothetical protein